MQTFKDKLSLLIAQSGAESVAVVVLDCASRRGLWIHPDLPFHPASTFKICVMMEVFRQAERGLFSLDDAIPVKNEFASIADGSLYSLSAADDADPELYNRVGSLLPIREITTRMITRSSNLATNILIERVTPGKVTAFMRRLGARELLVRRGVEDNRAFALGLNNAATARGLAHILRRLALGRVVSPSATDAMLAILKQQQFNEGIPSALPAGVVVAHKTGWNGKLYHDAAVVYPSGPEPDRNAYVVVIMTRGLPDDKEAPELVSALSRLIYENQPEWRYSED